MLDTDIDLADVLLEFATLHTVKKVEIQTVDFKKTEVVTPRQLACAVQPGGSSILKKLSIDIPEASVVVFTDEEIGTNDLIEYKGTDYRLSPVSNWSGYGFFAYTGVNTGTPLA